VPSIIAFILYYNIKSKIIAMTYLVHNALVHCKLQGKKYNNTYCLFK
jgi:hypothetical protein